MKKLMIAAGAVALASGAFATDPLVYDYTSSMTHMYVKLVTVQQKTALPYNGVNVPAGRVQVYQKYKKNASLKGYLIWDSEGATSPTISAAFANKSTAPVYDQGRNRAFLVVMNSSAEANVRAPKILPAVLDAKWFDTRFTHDATGASTFSAGIAEGTLFVGGQFINASYTQGSNYRAVAPLREKLDNGARLGYVTPDMYSDYLWTSCYLFGQYNGPQWSGEYQVSETQINTRLQPAFFRLPATHTFGQASAVYHDTWLNGAGIGTSELVAPGAGEICCGLSVLGARGGIILNSLAGQMKGGIYICSDNGYIQANGVYAPFLGVLWEDQFFSPAATAGLQWADPIGLNHDVWVDGDVEQNTTDVAFGSWSIKRTTSLAKVALTRDERNFLRHATYAAAADAPACWTVNGAVEPINGAMICNNVSLNDLNETIKGAAVRLLRTVNFCDGREIYDMTVASRFDIPFLTPCFARAYGLAGYGL